MRRPDNPDPDREYLRRPRHPLPTGGDGLPKSPMITLLLGVVSVGFFLLVGWVIYMMVAAGIPAVDRAGVVREALFIGLCVLTAMIGGASQTGRKLPGMAMRSIMGRFRR